MGFLCHSILFARVPLTLTLLLPEQPYPAVCLELLFADEQHAQTAQAKLMRDALSLPKHYKAHNDPQSEPRHAIF